MNTEEILIITNIVVSLAGAVLGAFKICKKSSCMRVSSSGSVIGINAELAAAV